ncbi:MAG TPA: sugar ABC transporter permease [Lachnospiraceae bacterium]|mgnify:CR=1 FL=1|nr:sugar ABC transporter permease [Lachnospiraceae bacterium]HBY71226.1 sugar ABC transporter permease [Lachnospiraceae bacterium]HCM13545.1 sugar ABC transporter permease [Lachnospiraceae bacterium]HCR40525.1 sugar ABC transporter permease [Lachnospiraceae bacterium]
MVKSKISKGIKVIMPHVLIIFFGLIMLYPLLWMVSSSLKESTEIFNSDHFLPTKITFSNYIQGWKGMMGVPFAKFFGNSFIIVVFSILGNVCSALLTGYAFSKLQFKLKKFWYVIMLGTMMLPSHVKLIPTYVVFNKLGWINTFKPMIIPTFFATNGFFVFLMTQYMRGLPKEIGEAARCDGCGPFNIFLRIIVPLSVPVITTTSIFTFIWTWNDFFTQNIYLSKVPLYTVSIALRQFTDAMGHSSWGAMFAMSTLSLIPLLVMFIAFQKYLVEGITAGSIKG